MTEATITLEDLAGSNTKIVHIAGQLDESNVDAKIQEVYQAVEASEKGLSLIFDLEGLEYMNSKSIGYLTDLYGKITESGGKVAICSAKPNIIDILQVVGLTQLIQTFDTLEQAKAEVSSSAPAEVPTVPQAPATPAEATAPAVQPTEAAPMPTQAAPQAEPAPTPTPAPVADIEINTPAPAVPVQPEVATPATPQQPTAPQQPPQNPGTPSA